MPSGHSDADIDLPHHLSRPGSELVTLHSALAAVLIGLLVPPWAGAAPAGTPAAAQDCGAAAAPAIPARPAAAVTGSGFLLQIAELDADRREAAILDQVERGNIPSFLRRMVRVPVPQAGTNGVTAICAMPDYLAVGSDDDYFMMPMRLDTALAIAARFGMTLPTRKMVDAIYDAAAVRLQPQPLPATDAMRSTGYYWRHNLAVLAQRAADAAPLGTLTAGDKKDLVLSPRLWSQQDRVAIYGWHVAPGHPIQPLSTVHGWRYADYSHGVRLISTIAYVEGSIVPLPTLLGEPARAARVSDEGYLPQPARLFALLEHPAAASAAGRMPVTPAGAASLPLPAVPSRSLR